MAKVAWVTESSGESVPSVEETGGLATFEVEVGEYTTFRVEVYAVPAGHDTGEEDAVVVSVRRVRPPGVGGVPPEDEDGVRAVGVEAVEVEDGQAAVFHIPPEIGVLKAHPKLPGVAYCPRTFCDGGLQDHEGECPQCVDRVTRGLPLPNPYREMELRKGKRRSRRKKPQK